MPPSGGSARFIQPLGGGFQPRRARFHVVLRVEVRARGVGRAGGIHDGQVPPVEQRLERRERRVQAEEAIQIDGGVFALVAAADGPRHGDGGPQIVVGLLAVRHHDVQAVGRAALENGHQDLLARRGRVGGIERALEPQRRRARPHHGQRRIAKKNAAIGHVHYPSNCF